MKLFCKFQRKRKQCKQCFKTFYKPKEILYIGWYGNQVTFDVCPYCGGSWIVV